MKNPLKFLKHVFKDPMNTIADADARKKEVIPCLVGSIVAAVLFSTLSEKVPALGFLTIFGIIAFFGIMAFGFMLFLCGKTKKKFEVLTCDKCKTLAKFENVEQYESHVSYSVVERRVNINPSINKNGNACDVRVSGEGKCDMSINLTCPHCGNTKTLKYVVPLLTCVASEKKVSSASASHMADSFKKSVNSILEDYLDDDKRKNIPYSIHSVHNPKYEDRNKLTLGVDNVAYPIYKGVKIELHRTAEESVEGFFLKNEVYGKITDPNKSKK